MEFHDFLKIRCCLTVPKNLLGEPFCVSQSFWYRENLMDKRGLGGKEYNHFLPKNFVGNLSVFHYFQVCKKFMPMRRNSRFSKENLLSHSTE